MRRFLGWFAAPEREERKPRRRTRADVIRGMSDEELADLAHTFAACPPCPSHSVCHWNMKRCKAVWVAYLREEVP